MAAARSSSAVLRGGSFGPLLVVPAAILLLGLLAYPLGLGVWLGFKDAKIGAYTSFAVRRGKLPVRSDACLDPAGVKPIPCPSG